MDSHLNPKFREACIDGLFITPLINIYQIRVIIEVCVKERRSDIHYKNTMKTSPLVSLRSGQVRLFE